MGPVIAFFGYAIWYRSRTQSVTISSDAITKKDKQYALSDIAEIMITNEAKESLASASPSGGGGLVIAGTGKAGVALAAGTVMGRAANEMVAGAGRSAQKDAANKGYAIQARHGRKKIRLVDCLDEDTAISVFNKIVSLTAA